ncbi:hypothetical protein PG994_004308 [Apiospora phragmitis]|uniref:Uncharacterized protein n=1 Tax=Apiospora phragmitis TaxID=2905665 RepID=A0ABR1VQ88_9PEZI
MTTSGLSNDDSQPSPTPSVASTSSHATTDTYGFPRERNYSFGWSTQNSQDGSVASRVAGRWLERSSNDNNSSVRSYEPSYLGHNELSGPLAVTCPASSSSSSNNNKQQRPAARPRRPE